MRLARRAAGNAREPRWGAAARWHLGAGRLIWLALGLLLAMLLGLSASRAQATTILLTLSEAQAAPSDWNAQQPPQQGWLPVSVPHDWNQQWPGHQGVIWYRLHWNIDGLPRDTGLYVDYLMQAGLIRVNGSTLLQDPSLSEPLSRMWNTPRYLMLPAALLHSGSNELLIRVSGYAAYQPALGSVQLGEPALMQGREYHSRFVRQSLQWLNIGLGATLGCFFLILWLMRRSEVAYGWFGLQQVAGLGFTFNFVQLSSWPFHTTGQYASMVSIAYVLYHGCSAMFVLRFMGQRWPRREAALWAVLLLACVAMMLAPQTALRETRNALGYLTSTLLLLTSAIFVYLALRQGNLPQRLLSLTAVFNAGVMVHDLLVFTRVLDSNFYLAAYTVNVSTVGIAIVLAYGFVSNTRRIENFNLEMGQTMERVSKELSASLARQYELEMLQVRLNERVSLAHDLHDGLGGMLIGNIRTLEQDGELVARARMLDMLRELRDDLRLIIDTSTAQQYGELSLAQLLAPLRYRFSQLFELHHLSLQWQVQGLDEVYLSTSHSLDLLRILQEALTNVFKHSQASQVQVRFVYQQGAVSLEVQDNGIGLSSELAAGAEDSSLPHGAGLSSMRNRAQRLGGSLSISSEVQCTLLRLYMPWHSDLHSPPAPPGSSASA